ncbi:MAG: carbohydrate porin [bacterium]|nr:carbohydrate porin [bacterium]
MVRRWIRIGGMFLVAMSLAAVFVGPPPASAQSAAELAERIKALESELNALKGMLQSIRQEQQAQKAKVEKQEKAIGPIQDLKSTVAALSKLEISGGITGILQNATNVESKLGGDAAFAEGSFDIIFTYKAFENVKFVLDLEGIGGNGPNGKLANLGGLNDDSGTTNDNVTILEAYGEGTFFKERLTITAGKIDLTNYVDGNSYAGSETSQFVSSPFVNNSVLSAPANAPGVRGRVDLVPGKFYVETGVMSQDVNGDGQTTDDVFADVYGVLEIGLTPKIFGKQGNYRVWGFLDGAGRKREKNTGRLKDFTASGMGVSFDQELTDWLGGFFRWGTRDTANTLYTTRQAWSAGFQLTGFLPKRKFDSLGVAYNEITPTKRDFGTGADEERLIEAYYRFHFAEKFHFSPFVQFLINRNANDRNNDITVFGARLQVDF